MGFLPLLISFFFALSAAKNIFRIRSQDPNQVQYHTLQVSDVFHKQQWLNCLRSAISIHRPLSESPSPTMSDAKHCSSPAIVHTQEAAENCPQPASESTPSSPRSPTLSSSSTRLSSSSTTSVLSAPLFSRTLHKSKKDKKSLCSLGKRKETMVWSEAEETDSWLDTSLVQTSVGLVFDCIITTVFDVTVLTGSYPSASHRASVLGNMHKFHWLQNGIANLYFPMTLSWLWREDRNLFIFNWVFKCNFRPVSGG